MGRKKASIESSDVLFAQSYLINRCKEDDEYILHGSITTQGFLVWLEDKLIDDESDEFELQGVLAGFPPNVRELAVAP